MRHLSLLLLVVLSLLVAGCGRGGPGPAPGGVNSAPPSNEPAAGTEPGRPEAVVKGYLEAIGRSDYKMAQDYLEHPRALVWPGIGALEAAFGAKVPPDVVRVSNVSAGTVFSASDRGDEVGCLARAHVAPGREGQRWGIGQEGDWRFAFYLIKREAGWRLARGMPIPQQLADYLEGGRNPFRNVASQLPEVAERGHGYRVAFDLELPKALSFVEEVDIAFLPEPYTEGYPRLFETAFSTYYYDTGGQKKLLSHFDQAVEIDPEMPSGKYRIYLGLGTKPPLYWPIPPYVVTIK